MLALSTLLSIEAEPLKFYFRLFVYLTAIVTFFACSSDDKTQTGVASQVQTEQTNELATKNPAAEKLNAYDAVKSLPRVVQGYKSIYRHWPRSIRDFDNGDYFFDSDYMAESINNGFIVYLALTENDPGFELWSLPERSEYGYQLAENGRNLAKSNKAQLLAEIERDYRIEAQKGALIFLLPNRTAD
jgi:hypothetical protein